MKHKTKSENSAARAAKVREEFKKYDLKKHRLDWVTQQLADKFFIAQSTVYAMIKEQGVYKIK